MATKKEIEKPRKFPWERPNGKLVDDISLVTSINKLIWRSFDEEGKERKCSKQPIFDRMFRAYLALKTAGIPTRSWILSHEYHRWVRTLCTDVEKAKRLIFRRLYRRGEKGEIYEDESDLREMGLKAELLFVSMIDQSKALACPECGCYAILRIPGTNQCIVVLLNGYFKGVGEPPIEAEDESDGRDA